MNSKANIEPLDLDAIEARANAATPGPWRADTDAVSDMIVRVAPWGSSVLREDCAGTPADVLFAASARSDVPALIARVRELEAALERIRNVGRSHAAPISEVRLIADKALRGIRT